MIIGLNASLLVPNALRWYWWRMNGWGYSLGTFAGILLSAIALFRPGIPVYYIFPSICGASLLVAIVASLASRPVDSEVLIHFYKSVRPFGLWGPIRGQADLSVQERSLKSESVSLTLLNVLVGMAAICGLYLFPMYLVGHWYSSSLLWFAIAASAIITLRYTWYPNLPAPDESERRDRPQEP